MAWFVAIIACLSLIRNGLANFPFPRHLELEFEGDRFDWSTIKPSKELEYHDCHGRFKCARLLVPLDWLASEDARYNETTALAIIKLPATVPITDPTYGGAVLTNPGGPGGSGIVQVLGSGDFLQLAISSRSKQFDIVSFDPRGVSLSGPDASCFSDPLHRDAWNIKRADEGILDASDRILGLQWARAKALGTLCSGTEMGQYMSTASVARDMVEIIDRIEEHRVKLLGRRPVQSLLADKTHKHPMLQYIGFSYGTLLGNTFASMFPDRVGRMVLDGVVDAPDYIAQGWSTNLQDTEQVMQSFFEYCFEGGSRCPLYDSAGIKAIGNNFHKFLENLKENPIVVVGNAQLGVMSHSDIMQLVFLSFYDPIEIFPIVAALVDQLQKGEYDLALRFLAAFQVPIHCPIDGKTILDELSTINEAQMAVICGDGESMLNQSVAEFREYLELLESQSSTAGAIWASIRLMCTGWQVRPTWRYTGPFGGNTSTPILWIGNTADPVTPIRNARSMSKLFPSSVVLQHDAVGHCSLTNAPSACNIKIIQQYFLSGTLPKDGTICPAARKPFDKKLQSSTRRRADPGMKNLRESDIFEIPAWRSPLEIRAKLDAVDLSI